MYMCMTYGMYIYEFMLCKKLGFKLLLQSYNLL